jgi:hypothetical protein
MKVNVFLFEETHLELIFSFKIKKIRNKAESMFFKTQKTENDILIFLMNQNWQYQKERFGSNIGKAV